MPKQHSPITQRKLQAAGLWPNNCPECDAPMQFAYGRGRTVEARAARAYRRCKCGTTVTAAQVMNARGGSIER